MAKPLQHRHSADPAKKQSDKKYLSFLSRKVEEKQKYLEKEARLQREEIALKLQDRPKLVFTTEERIYQARVVAELMFLKNRTLWNYYEDQFFIINRHWFLRWCEFVCYEYVVENYRMLEVDRERVVESVGKSGSA